MEPTTRWRVAAMMALAHALFMVARAPMPRRIQAWLCLRAADVLRHTVVIAIGTRKAKWHGIHD